MNNVFDVDITLAVTRHLTAFDKIVFDLPGNVKLTAGEINCRRSLLVI